MRGSHRRCNNRLDYGPSETLKRQFLRAHVSFPPRWPSGRRLRRESPLFNRFHVSHEMRGMTVKRRFGDSCEFFRGSLCKKRVDPPSHEYAMDDYDHLYFGINFYKEACFNCAKDKGFHAYSLTKKNRLPLLFPSRRKEFQNENH